ncbi:cytochrome P450 [Tricladium varicosporioides]|nr:cytochrome P450 [Hymenoscyphus varicosporioides]
MATYLYYFSQALLLIILYLLSSFIYYTCLHPLRSYPGPKLWAFTRLPFTYHKLSGRSSYTLKDLHDKYGEVVRIGPNHLSYNSSTAWENIYGFNKGAKVATFVKDRRERGFNNGIVNIINANDTDHRRMRRLQAHAFSDKALTAQEPILRQYVKQFTSGLLKESKSSPRSIVSLGKWFNLTTFDLIGDLAFGEPFGCCATGEMHPWVRTIFELLEIGTWRVEMNFYPLIGMAALMLVLPKGMRSKADGHKKMSADKAERRMGTRTERPDFMTYMLKHNGEERGMSDEEIKAGAHILIAAGSETTASTMTGMSYYLLKNRPVLDRLTKEIRERFKNEDEMDLHSLAEHRYLNAVIEEGMRLFPAVPSTFPRVTPPQGGIICGRFVPGGTTVGVNFWAASHSASNFTSPESFIPERWFPTPIFPTDDLKANQPFSYGPNNCLGKNLAYAEMRLLLAHLVWNFDLDLVEEKEGNWIDRCKIFILWVKPELKVKLTARA